MTQSIVLPSSESRPQQPPRRGKLRRTVKPAGERRAQFIRSDVRRGIAEAQEAPAAGNADEASALVREKLATSRVQASIVAAMLGMLVFFRAPLASALGVLFG